MDREFRGARGIVVLDAIAGSVHWRAISGVSRFVNLNEYLHHFELPSCTGESGETLKTEYPETHSHCGNNTLSCEIVNVASSPLLRNSGTGIQERRTIESFRLRRKKLELKLDPPHVHFLG
jgi:hypothetical protein